LDGDFTASDIGDGKTMVVWSSAAQNFGVSMPAESVPGYLNGVSQLKYCVFDADGIPGAAATLNDYHCAVSLPRVTYDGGYRDSGTAASTGRVLAG
jgi:hypothetical protein